MIQAHLVWILDFPFANKVDLYDSLIPHPTIRPTRFTVAFATRRSAHIIPHTATVILILLLSLLLNTHLPQVSSSSTCRQVEKTLRLRLPLPSSPLSSSRSSSSAPSPHSGWLSMVDATCSASTNLESNSRPKSNDLPPFSPRACSGSGEQCGVWKTHRSSSPTVRMLTFFSDSSRCSGCRCSYRTFC